MEFEDINVEASLQTPISLLLLLSKKDQKQRSKNYSIVLNFLTAVEAKKFYETLNRIYEAMKKEEHKYKEW